MTMQIKYAVNEIAALTSYYSLFDSILHYGLLVFSSAANINIAKVCKVQKSAIRCIANLKQHDSCRPYFRSLNIITLYGLIIYKKLIHVRKNISDFHSYNTRHCNNLLPTDWLDAGTNNKEIKLYNALPDEF
ncbi:unnamed protein product [Acanthoscelides obtectus]|uniref:Uncharacterized protein n=1 Tax=Acanthoscelides obtectus TaxID=200917 RepID=A0A9P0LJ44_ACAOB|nr:unnamed protein product [Acanthoscelides obtectus]CAK1669845.1 hypothetical protein AOBTE_LOCUS27269 [Acanthoscelides obtectus]